MLSRPVRWLRLILRELNALLLRVERALGASPDPRRHRARVLASTRAHDMLRHPDEPYYAERYWEIAAPHLQVMAPGGRHLDVGCGQGRLTLRVAEWCAAAGGVVTGVDLSSHAVAIGEAAARDHAVGNLSFVVGDAQDFLATIAPASVRTVWLTEVLFFHPDADRLWRDAVRVLEPGGLMFASFRSRYFHALLTVGTRMWEDVPVLLSQPSGRLRAGESVQQWWKSSEVRDAVRAAGLRELVLAGVGTCSGIPGDPHAGLARPSELDAKERAALAALERATGAEVPDAGRYMFVVAQRTDG